MWSGRYDEDSDAWEFGAPPRRGVTVALLAPDGAGKSTLTEGLAEQLPVPVETFYMGAYSAAARSIPVPGARLVQRLGRLWRAALDGARARRRGAVVIYDRYSYDMLLPASGTPSRTDRAYRAAFARALPAPDLAVVLDVPAEVLLARKQEHALPELERQRAGYASLVGRLPCPTVLIDASRDAGTVRRDVTAHIARALQQRG